MSDETEPIAPPEQTVKPLSHGRILKIMGVIGFVGSVLGALFVSIPFGLGVFIGSLLAFVNYYWLKLSLKKIFDAAAKTGERPRMLGLKYFARYLVLGAVVAILYATHTVSMIGLILGMGSFGFAVVFEGLFNIFSGPARTGEN